MAMFENFPYTNLHELNLDWLIQELKNMESTSVLSVNGQTGYVTLYEDAKITFPEVVQDKWQMVRTADGMECGILFDSDGTAYIVKGANLYQLYSSANQPPYPVQDVNGMTGHVELFTEQYVRLPNLTDEEMHQWNLYRHINGITSGIQFSDDGKAYIMVGNNRYMLYTQNDQPPYPVTSVNGATGAVTLYPDADVVLPTVLTGSAWSITRTINGTVVGIEFDGLGACSLIIGEDNYPLYIQGLNDPSDFDDPSSIVLELTENLSSGTEWGIVRSVQNNDKVGILFKYNSSEAVYEAFLKTNNTLVKLLTLDDIPSTTGVVSINGLTGVVSLSGNDINVSSLVPTTIATAISNLDNMTAMIASGMVKIINGNTSTLNLYANQYVMVINSTIANITDGVYQMVNAVNAGTTVGEADLNPITAGAMNVLRSEMNAHNTTACTGIHSHVNVKQNTIEQFGNIVVISIAIDVTDTITTSSHLMTVPSEYRPSSTRSAMFALLNINDTTIRANPNNIRIGTDGYIFQNLTSSWSSGYIEAIFIYPKT